MSVTIETTKELLGLLKRLNLKVASVDELLALLITANFHVESTRDLLTLLKRLNLEITSVDELRRLLETINAAYNPYLALQKTSRFLCFTVPSNMAWAAGISSFFLAGHLTVGGLAVIWGSVALVSTASVIAGSILTGIGTRQRSFDVSQIKKSASIPSILTAITNELPR